MPSSYQILGPSFKQHNDRSTSHVHKTKYDAWTFICMIRGEVDWMVDIVCYLIIQTFTLGFSQPIHLRSNNFKSMKGLNSTGFSEQQPFPIHPRNTIGADIADALLSLFLAPPDGWGKEECIENRNKEWHILIKFCNFTLLTPHW